MLIELNLENYRSIKEEVSLNMISTKDSSFENNLIKTDVLKEESLLKSAVIYGANASGKTNILLALNFLQRLVMTSHKHQKGNKLPYSPFKLDKQTLSKPTRIRIVFIKNETKYIYEISFNSEKIITEYLYSYPNNYKKIIFERTDSLNYKFIDDEKKQRLIAERTLPNVLYLSKATQENYEVVSKVYDWFKDELNVIGPTDHPGLIDITAKMLKSGSMKELILKAMLEADIGIDDISVDTKKLKIEDLPKGIPPEIKKMMMNNKEEIEQTKINTIHKGVNFDFEEESDGTMRLFSLIGPWITALKDGNVLIVDELDTKLHHLLNVFLIELFHDPTQNKKNAQLIFTTHNTNLLDIQDIFRRDQIWFTKKNQKGATDLYSLVEYSPRKDKNIERGYLAGKYGALPFIKENKIF